MNINWFKLFNWFIITWLIYVVIQYYFSFVPELKYEMIPGRGTDENVVVSPADGTIMDIEEICKIDGVDFIRIRIFIHITSSHVQYFPCVGTYISQEHIPGKFYPAGILEKTKYNERCKTIIRSKKGNSVVIIEQIAGIFARTVQNINYDVGDNVNYLMPIGKILLGSACDIYVEKEKVRINKKNIYIGANVTSPYTVIGEIK